MQNVLIWINSTTKAEGGGGGVYLGARIIVRRSNEIDGAKWHRRNFCPNICLGERKYDYPSTM